MKDFKKRLLSLAGGAGLAGFTLIELVLVIIIISILSALSLPRFINLKTQANIRSDDAIAAALNLGLKNKFLENISSGIAPESAWPTGNPFTYLARGGTEVPNQGWFDTCDNYNWRTSECVGDGWRIFCPHWNGTQVDGTATKGRKYIYKYGTGSWPDTGPQGEFLLWNDAGH